MSHRSLLLIAPLIVGSVGSAGCSGDFLDLPDGARSDGTAAGDAAPQPPDLAPRVDPSAPYFDPAHIVEVDIQLAPPDWDTIRAQARSLVDLLTNCLKGPFPDPFTYVKGQVTIDGKKIADVGVRKKGFLGSLDPVKPALKLKFDEYVPGQRFAGLKGFTLNNSKQDPSYIHQCLAYRQFKAAGIPSSRCNFAHVRVNGNDLGLFVHVEGGNQDFLEGQYPNPDGNLYEGTLSDFRDGWTETFDLKTNEKVNDRTDLAPVVAALKAPDEQLIAQLDKVVDIERFISFWATEALVAHWDGYDSNNNNFLAYHNPATGKFEFLPWGTDSTFNRGPNPVQKGAPTSVMAASLLSRRLYSVPQTRDRYLARMRELLKTAWDEAAIVAEINRMQALITPIADPGGKSGLGGAINAARDFVTNRRAEIEAEFAGGPPVLSLPLPNAPCFLPIGNVSGSFQTTWGTAAAMDPLGTGTGTLTGMVYGSQLQVVRAGSTAGLDPNAMPPGTGPVQLAVIALLNTNIAEIVVFQLAPPRYVPNATLTVDWTSVNGAVYRFIPLTNSFEPVGIFSDGTLHITAAGNTPGAPVSGTFTGNIIRSPF